MIETLGDRSKQFGCLVGIYCFMPDHLHFILCGQNEGSDAKAACNGFKQFSSRWLLQNHPTHSWQSDYHDHIIRKSDDWRRHVFYVYMNPVRAGLVSRPADYPFTGAIGFDLQDLLIDAHY